MGAARFRIVHEDAQLVVVDKAPGVPVIPARGEAADACLYALVGHALGERLWVVHRIDRDTSGLVVFARDPGTHRALSMAFEARTVVKTYVAFVAGTPTEPSGRIDLPLHAARKGKMRPVRPADAAAQPASTHYRVDRVWSRDTLVVSRLQVRPLTGRQHQIRVHLRALEVPILFDSLYGGPRHAALDGAPVQRLALHALALTIPETPGGDALSLSTPLAPDLVDLENWLERTLVSQTLRKRRSQ